MTTDKGLRVVNLEFGKPTVQVALQQMAVALVTSSRMGYGAVKFIHGYGSSGTGGKIRTAARQKLNQQRAAGQLQAVIPGEKFSIFEEETRAAFFRCPELRRDEDLERYNNGITIVIL